MADLSLYKTFSSGMTDYITRHNANYTLIENFCNLLAGLMPTATATGTTASGLSEIFDRKGVIGVDSYSFNEGVLASPYNLSVAAGGFWSGAAFLSKATATSISLSGQATGTYYLYLDAAGNPAIASMVQANTIYQFDWNSSTHTVSNKALYTGTAILFSGADYADMLTSTALGETFTSVADRLEFIESMLSGATNFYGEDAANHSGLDFAYFAGKVRNDSVIYDTVAGTVTLANNATNYIEVDPASGTVSANTSGFTSGQIPLFQVVTAGGAISTVTDKRTWAVAGTGGEGGGHTQGTDLGTTASTFTLDTDAAGTPTGRAGLIVENGAALNAEIAFNRDTGKWQYTVDGGATWTNLGEFAGETGAEVSKYVPVDDPIKVLEDLSRSSSADYEDLDLSASITAPNGVQAVALLVYFWDSAPGAGVNVLFRKKDSAAAPSEGFTVWSGQADPGLRLIPVNDDLVCQFYVNASGSGTANLRIYLVGYYEKVSAVGPAGDTGPAGSAWLTSSGVPDNGDGDDGDYDLNTVNGDVYEKQSGSWVLVGNIKGVKGDQGDPGTTVDTTKVFSDVTVGAGATVQSNLTGFITRGLVHRITIAASGVEGTFDVKVYDGDDFTTVIYELSGVDPLAGWDDSLPWMHIDKDASNELHIQIKNNDGSNSGTYTVTIRAEKFA